MDGDVIFLLRVLVNCPSIYSWLSGKVWSCLDLSLRSEMDTSDEVKAELGKLFYAYIYQQFSG